MTKKITQEALVMEYYTTHPNRAILRTLKRSTGLTEEYLQKELGTSFAIRIEQFGNWHKQGKLVKLGKGVYKYDPDLITNPELEDFTPAQREQIFKRDDYRCVICGKGATRRGRNSGGSYQTKRLRWQSDN